MAVQINTKSPEDWNSRDFAFYVRQKLSEKNVRYQIKYPGDLIAISAILKVYKRTNKSPLTLVKYIDQILAEHDLSKVQNLNFIRTLALSDCEKTTFAQKKRDRKPKEKTRDKFSKLDRGLPPLSYATTDWLDQLKIGELPQ